MFGSPSPISMMASFTTSSFKRGELRLQRTRYFKLWSPLDALSILRARLHKGEGVPCQKFQTQLPEDDGNILQLSVPSTRSSFTLPLRLGGGAATCQAQLPQSLPQALGILRSILLTSARKLASKAFTTAATTETLPKPSKALCTLLGAPAGGVGLALVPDDASQDASKSPTPLHFGHGGLE